MRMSGAFGGRRWRLILGAFVVAAAGLGASPCESVPDSVEGGVDEVAESNQSGDSSGDGAASDSETSADEQEGSQQSSSTERAASAEEGGSESNGQGGSTEETDGWRGGDTSAVSEGYSENEPEERCDDASDWEEHASGEPVFFSHAWDYTLMCGSGIRGLDSMFSEREDMLIGGTFDADAYGSQTRLHLGRALMGEELDPARASLYRTALNFFCFSHTEWSADDYGTYRFCRNLTDDMPSRSEVEGALQKHFPDKTFEQKNFLYMYDRSRRDRGEVVATFDEIEEKYPGLEQVFVEPAEQARKRYAELREEFSDIYETLDPMSERIAASHASDEDDRKRRRDGAGGSDAQQPLDSGCEETLLSMRDKLRQEVQPTDQQGVDRVRADHPLGYQITEALEQCYAQNDDRQAKRTMARQALSSANRRVTRREMVYFARFDAYQQVRESGAKVPDGLEDSFGFLKDPFYALIEDRPTFNPPERVDGIGAYAADGAGATVRGSAGGNRPARIVGLNPTDEGVEVRFEHVRQKIEMQTYKCQKTDKIDHYEKRGQEIVPVYREKCRKGPVKTHTADFQADPVVVSERDAELLEKGMEVRVLTFSEYDGEEETFENPEQVGDSALIDAWWPDEGRKEGAVVQDGIELF